MQNTIRLPHDKDQPINDTSMTHTPNLFVSPSRLRVKGPKGPQRADASGAAQQRRVKSPMLHHMAHRIGVIGVGIIGEPVVRGLIGAHGDNVEIRLSPRNAERSAALASAFANVEVAASNQEVVDCSDWLIVALLPSVAQEVLRELTFRPGQRLVSLIGTADIAALREWTGVAAITRMVPLPYVAQRTGPIAAYPVTPALEEVFGGLGTLVAADDEDGLNTLSTVTSMQSAFFATVGEVVGWASRHGVTPEAAQRFTIDFFAALLAKAEALTPSELAEHWREMTPGGLNHTAMTHLQHTGAITAWSDAMQAVDTRRHSGS